MIKQVTVVKIAYPDGTAEVKFDGPAAVCVSCGTQRPCRLAEIQKNTTDGHYLAVFSQSPEGWAKVISPKNEGGKFFLCGKCWKEFLADWCEFLPRETP